ncbi:uncharacterized protein MONBRDRAFT_30278 [Monosiga brevicollis MX1]|uniref:Uncharacterized protein n=1 Tax=Monosiga brevicollis TaxID=81824 RepID=A9VDI1_MONBE|nr:uncharacterized protein MONBRDRAFT_30278 [Monosiga brevicollis MX1]EDQ84372.1 predicted protein [Monosiga brevicollis MX1]|eukprot:XP_001750773.1 hypothetical protein [Monosiga brevicollis MX1]
MDGVLLAASLFACGPGVGMAPSLWMGGWSVLTMAMAARAERALVKTRHRITRAIEEREYYEASQLVLSLASRLHALERDAEAVGELRNVLQQLIDHGQDKEVVSLARTMVTTPEYRAQLSLEEWAPVLTRMQDARQAKVLALALIQNWAGSPDQQTAAHVALWEAMATALAPRAQASDVLEAVLASLVRLCEMLVTSEAKWFELLQQAVTSHTQTLEDWKGYINRAALFSLQIPLGLVRRAFDMCMAPLGASGVAPTPLAEFVDRVLATLTRDALSLFEDLRVAYADVLEQHAATNPLLDRIAAYYYNHQPATGSGAGLGMLGKNIRTMSASAVKFF